MTESKKQRPPRARRAAAPVQRTWLQRVVYNAFRVVARFVGVTLYGLRVEGREHFPDEGGALVCANHQSFFDPILVGLTCDRRLNYLARKSLFKVPLLKHIIRFMDSIPVDRSGGGIEGLKETLKRLRRGELVLIFPEGTRTRDGELAPLKPGFCALVRRGRTAVVPVAIDGAFHAWPRTAKLPRLARIHIEIGEPIPPELAEQLTDEQLVAELSERIRGCFERARAARATT